MTRQFIDVTSLELDHNGRVVLPDEMLDIIEDLAIVTAGGTNEFCQGSGNGSCTNHVCGGSTNSACSNIYSCSNTNNGYGCETENQMNREC